MGTELRYIKKEGFHYFHKYLVTRRFTDACDELYAPLFEKHIDSSVGMSDIGDRIDRAGYIFRFSLTGSPFRNKGG
jgi:hypothetical protein